MLECGLILECRNGGGGEGCGVGGNCLGLGDKGVLGRGGK